MPASPYLPRRQRQTSPLTRKFKIDKGPRTTHHDAVPEDGVHGVDGDLRDVRRGGDVREVRPRPPRLVAQVDEPADEAVEPERDVHGREQEHEHRDPEDDRRDLARVPEAQDVDVGAEQTQVDAWQRAGNPPARRSREQRAVSMCYCKAAG